MTLATGQVLQNRYRIISLLGQGGMGAVYRAWDTRLNVPVALKEMTQQPGLDLHILAQLRKQFQQEAAVLARLDHPHLVRVSDFFEEESKSYLVMNLVEGESLADRIARQGPLPERDVLAWADQLLDALTYCHNQGVIHRDVKPQNVIIRPDGRAALVDFGLVKLWDPHDPHTRTAIRAMGTPEYAPPEQYDVAAGHTDARSDVYSLGAMLYHALTGQAPPTATMRIVNPTALKPVRVLNPRVSPHVETALARALELQPEFRFGSAQEMAAALSGGTSAPARPAPPKRQPTKMMPGARPAIPLRKRVPGWVWAVGGLGGLAFVGGIAAVLIRYRPAPPVTETPAEEMRTSTAETVPAPEDTPSPTLTEVVPLDTPISTPKPTATYTPIPPPTATPEVRPPDTPTSTPRPTATHTPIPPPTPTPTPESPYPPGITGRIAFTRNPHGHQDSTHEIYLLELSTGSVHRLTNNSVADWDPDWSPDGERIVFVSFQLDNYDIWAMRGDGGGQTARIALPAWDDYPAWSPDGSQIAIASTGITEGVANSEIFVGSGTGSIRQVTFNTGRDEWPSWAPDGQWLACSSDRDGDMDIYLFTTDGGNIVHWTDDPAYEEQPAWSPDGQWIAFIRKTQETDGDGVLERRDDGDFGNLWTGRRDGSEFRQLTYDNRAADPAWSPDGRYVVFTHARDTTGDGYVGLDDASDLWVVPATGGDPIVLLEGPEQDWAPDWTW